MLAPSEESIVPLHCTYLWLDISSLVGCNKQRSVFPHNITAIRNRLERVVRWNKQKCPRNIIIDAIIFSIVTDYVYGGLEVFWIWRISSRLPVMSLSLVVCWSERAHRCAQRKWWLWIVPSFSDITPLRRDSWRFMQLHCVSGMPSQVEACLCFWKSHRLIIHYGT